MLVFFITCFLPFIKPNISQIADTEFKKARKTSKFLISEVEPDFAGNPIDQLSFLN